MPAFARVPEAQLVAAADPSPERLAWLRSAVPGCRAFLSAQALLEAVELDAVLIATPPSCLSAMARLALRAGLPALVEKPVVQTLADARELLDLAHRAFLMAGFNRRHWAPVEALHCQLAASGAEDPTVANLILTSDVLRWSPVSHTPDALEDLGSHQLDLLRFVLGREVRSVSAKQDSHAITLQLSFSGGVSATCRAAEGSVSREKVQIRRGKTRWEVRAGSERTKPTGGLRAILDFRDNALRRLRRKRSLMAQSYEKQLTRFVAAVRSGQGPSPGVSDAVRVLAIMTAARQSAGAGGQHVVPDYANL